MTSSRLTVWFPPQSLEGSGAPPAVEAELSGTATLPLEVTADPAPTAATWTVSWAEGDCPYDNNNNTDTDDCSIEMDLGYAGDKYIVSNITEVG